MGRHDGCPRRRHDQLLSPGALARLNRQLDDAERQRIKEQAGGIELTGIAGNLLAAIDPDGIDAKAREIDRTPRERRACSRRRGQGARRVGC